MTKKHPKKLTSGTKLRIKKSYLNWLKTNLEDIYLLNTPSGGPYLNLSDTNDYFIEKYISLGGKYKCIYLAEDECMGTVRVEVTIPLKLKMYFYIDKKDIRVLK